MKHLTAHLHDASITDAIVIAAGDHEETTKAQISNNQRVSDESQNRSETLQDKNLIFKNRPVSDESQNRSETL